MHPVWSRKLLIPVSMVLLLSLQGCLAKTAVDLATLPVRAASKAVDLATTSQSEADENRGREMRKMEEKLGKLSRKYDDLQRDCLRGDQDDCHKARKIYTELQELQGKLPGPPPSQ